MDGSGPGRNDPFEAHRLRTQSKEIGPGLYLRGREESWEVSLVNTVGAVWSPTSSVGSRDFSPGAPRSSGVRTQDSGAGDDGGAQGRS